MKRLLLGCLLLACLGGIARADIYRPAYLELRQTAADSFDLLWKLPARGENRRLALSLDLPPEVEQHGPTRSVYVGGAFVDTFGITRLGGLTGARIAVSGLDSVDTEVLGARRTARW